MKQRSIGLMLLLPIIQQAEWIWSLTHSIVTSTSTADPFIGQ